MWPAFPVAPSLVRRRGISPPPTPGAEPPCPMRFVVALAGAALKKVLSRRSTEPASLWIAPAAGQLGEPGADRKSRQPGIVQRLISPAASASGWRCPPPTVGLAGSVQRAAHRAAMRRPQPPSRRRPAGCPPGSSWCKRARPGSTSTASRTSYRRCSTAVTDMAAIVAAVPRWRPIWTRFWRVSRWRSADAYGRFRDPSRDLQPRRAAPVRLRQPRSGQTESGRTCSPG